MDNVPDSESKTIFLSFTRPFKILMNYLIEIIEILLITTTIDQNSLLLVITA